jgi:F1F0 ATPase subunit 2
VIIGLIVAFVIGLLLAVANYTVLWFTVKKLVSARNPAALALASFHARTAIVVLGFYIVTKGDPVRLVVCALGFLLVRTIAVRRVAAAGSSGEGVG